MAVGNQANSAAIGSMLSQDAIELRNICDKIRMHNTYISSLGSAGLAAAGFTAADATTAQQLMGFLNNVAAVYYGAATQANLSNYDQALSVLWAAS